MSKILVGSNFNYKNLIINGAFDIWQRGEDVTGQDGYLGVDRFRVWQDTDGNAFDIRNVKSVDGFINISRYEVSNTDSDATYNNFGVTQRVEPLIYAPHIGEKLTLSFWVKSNKTSIKVYIKHNYTDSDGNEQEEILYSADLTIVGDSWNKIEQTFVLDSAALQDTSNTTNWVELFAIEVDGVTDGDYLELKEVQVERGNIATDFERVPYDVELARCMRYYEDVYADFRAYSDNNFYPMITYTFIVEKRTTPSVVANDIATVNLEALNFSTDETSTNECRLILNMNPSDSGEIRYSGVINCDAEL